MVGYFAHAIEYVQSLDIDQASRVDGKGRCKRRQIWISRVVYGQGVDFIADHVDRILLAELHQSCQC